MLKYKLKQIKSSIFVVSIKDRYDRGMLFCRAQEFYESPNPRFRNRSFSIWDFIEWYSRDLNGFSYPFDWEGYNIPFEIAEKCYFVSKIENKYDETFKEIINEIKNKVGNNKAYIIGVNENKDLYKHEMCHALYYLSKNYRDQSNKIISNIDNKIFKSMYKNLLYMGYTKKVIKDEIQAYLISDFFYGSFYKNIDKNKIFIPRKELVENFDKNISNML